MPDSSNDVTKLLLDWRNGDRQALDKLMPIVYDELGRLAASYLRRERQGHTLQPTALVNEAYMRLMDQTRSNWQNRAQFFGIAAQAMRRILTDHARSQQAAKRGSGDEKFELDEAIEISDGKSSPDLIALDDALNTLAQFDERQSRIVELRYFGGLEITEVAEALNISPATVKREWNSAKAWLFNQLNKR
ncbi:MAG: sigma-70 family RNA polymerase sigma factor [Blastocatellia bacterium]